MVAELRLTELAQQHATTMHNRRLEYLERMYRIKTPAAALVGATGPAPQAVPQPAPSDGGPSLG